MFTKATKVKIQMPTGFAPGIVTSDRIVTEYRESKTTGRTYPIQKIEVVSFRTPTRVKNQYYQCQFEPVAFLFSRDEDIPEIDAIPMDEAVARAERDRMAFNQRVQSLRLATTADRIVSMSDADAEAAAGVEIVSVLSPAS